MAGTISSEVYFQAAFVNRRGSIKRVRRTFRMIANDQDGLEDALLVLCVTVFSR